MAEDFIVEIGDLVNLISGEIGKPMELAVRCIPCPSTQRVGKIKKTIMLLRLGI